MRPLVLVLALLPLPAAAACPGGEEVFSCSIEGRTLRLCHSDGALVYGFGPPGKPELVLSQPLTTVDFTPWPGVGRSMWETVAFPNEGYVYEVWTSVERDPEATEGRTGGVDVLRGDVPVARLTCDPGTPSQSLDVIYELKEAAGLCWDHGASVWTRTCE
ncbi:hypothetical protein [Salinarimonas chemoclinalis]|uniref:hypothetical protein n=1 Tax=Salinarimonas chemoclinalis TaxID=3241599 RepID=UPI003557969F